MSTLTIRTVKSEKTGKIYTGCFDGNDLKGFPSSQLKAAAKAAGHNSELVGSEVKLSIPDGVEFRTITITFRDGKTAAAVYAMVSGKEMEVRKWALEQNSNIVGVEFSAAELAALPVHLAPAGIFHTF